MSPVWVRLLIGVASAKWPNEPIPKTKIPQLYDGGNNAVPHYCFGGWMLGPIKIASVTHYMH